MHDLKVLLYLLPTVPEVVPATSVDESVLPANDPENIFTEAESLTLDSLQLYSTHLPEVVLFI